MSLSSNIGLISATKKESGIIFRNLKKTKLRNFYSGRIGNNHVIHVISGIGKTNASHAATLLIEKFSPSLIINFGIGGAYPSADLKIGDIAVANKEVYGDEGLRLKDGFYTADAIGIPFLKTGRKKYFNEFPFDKKLVGRIMKAGGDEGRIKGGLGDYKIKSGTFVTVSTITGTNKRAKELERRFHAICENMEGAAVAHICAMYGIKVLEIRGISNIVEDRDKNKWDTKLAAENCQWMVIGFLRQFC